MTVPAVVAAVADLLTRTERLLYDDALRLRTPWRLAIGLPTFLLAAVAASLASSRLLPAVPRPFQTAAGAALLAAALTLAAAGLARFVDGRRVAGYGIGVDAAWLRDFAGGLATGIGLIAAVGGVGLAAGWYRVDAVLVADGVAFLPWTLGYVGLFLAAGYYEELLVRGYLLTTLAEGATLGGRLDRGVAVGIAVAVTAPLFAAAHLSNPGASPAITAGIAVAGVTFGVAYVATGNLGYPVGLHVGWNVAQGVGLGLPVSGIVVETAVVDLVAVGPALVTGGGFGPEAGVLGIVAVFAGATLSIWWARLVGADGL